MSRRSPAPLPPVGVALTGLPLIERLRVKSLEEGAAQELLLTTQYADLSQVEDEFWQAFEGLDREALLEQTQAVLAQAGRPMSLAELAEHIPPGAHDLETLTLWLALAQEAGADAAAAEPEHITTHDGNQPWRFTLPRVQLDARALECGAGEW